MKILVLTSFDLFPPVHGGSSIAYNFIKHAAARHDVYALVSHLYSLGGKQDLASDKVHIQYYRPSLFDHLRVLSFVINPHFYRAADHLCRESQPDVIQCETLWPALTGWYLRRKYRVPLICVEYNVEGDKFRELGRSRPIVALVRVVERFVVRQADRVITVSEADRQLLLEEYGADALRVQTIPPSPDLSDFHFEERLRSAVRARYGLLPHQPLLSFVGNLKYEPNQEAVRRIAEYVYPAVLERHPDALFVVIGQGEQLLAEYCRERLVFSGYLSRKDLVAHLSATDIFVVPVETGSGIRVKIPEATACGRAVVATQRAAQGLELFGDDEIMRTDGVGPEFVAAVLRLIEDPVLRNAIGARAQARTQQALGWEKTLGAYEEVYAQVGAH